LQSAERLAGEVLAAVDAHRKVILDADAAEGAELLDARPVDLVTARICARFS
jgi:hypothetical protein